MSKFNSELVSFKTTRLSEQQKCQVNIFQMRPITGRKFNVQHAKVIIRQVLEQFSAIINENEHGGIIIKCKATKYSRMKQSVYDVTNRLREMILANMMAFNIKTDGRYKLIVYVIHVDDNSENSSSSPSSSILVTSRGLCNNETDCWVSDTERTVYGQFIAVVYACYHE
ncbi:unnamed protein product [Heterobilharzia americana]|nr:unnamed protein product [Heterobilharzia americana]